MYSSEMLVQAGASLELLLDSLLDSLEMLLDTELLDRLKLLSLLELLKLLEILELDNGEDDTETVLLRLDTALDRLDAELEELDFLSLSPPQALNNPAIARGKK